MFGLSSQSTVYQKEVVDRLRLPFPMVCDTGFRLAAMLGLPTFEAGGVRLYKRLTLVIRDGVVEHVFYPVFPPDKHAQQVLRWLQDHPGQTKPVDITRPRRTGCSGGLPVMRALARPDDGPPARRRSPLPSLSPLQPGSISGVEARQETVPRFVIREGLGAAAGVHSSTLWCEEKQRSRRRP
ncbi:redoxin family protein [Streptomyces sp. NBC_00268]|uniref:redoxin family protein n=1 Tax=Streptomyces sp. NBC_00268 TaxID=2975695 RepID=UPI00225B5541|nr:redoxin family protein [Streptomyces sp. NBC_00268]MCX5181132.1 redoxin family protein [Streptomyces sp. NBC_00268]MCX5191056.1 redoxin family protein [Streptomyces sp. NBC_00268]